MVFAICTYISFFFNRASLSEGDTTSGAWSSSHTASARSMDFPLVLVPSKAKSPLSHLSSSRAQVSHLFCFANCYKQVPGPRTHGLQACLITMRWAMAPKPSCLRIMVCQPGGMQFLYASTRPGSHVRMYPVQCHRCAGRYQARQAGRTYPLMCSAYPGLWSLCKEWPGISHSTMTGHDRAGSRRLLGYSRHCV